VTRPCTARRLLPTALAGCVLAALALPAAPAQATDQSGSRRPSPEKVSQKKSPRKSLRDKVRSKALSDVERLTPPSVANLVRQFHFRYPEVGSIERGSFNQTGPEASVAWAVATAQAMAGQRGVTLATVPATTGLTSFIREGVGARQGFMLGPHGTPAALDQIALSMGRGRHAQNVANPMVVVLEQYRDSTGGFGGTRLYNGALVNGQAVFVDGQTGRRPTPIQADRLITRVYLPVNYTDHGPTG
jgi:hypothetical protein